MSTKHGEATKGRETPEYRTWNRMKDRCLNPNAKNYAYYGGRGVFVCARWARDYRAFLADMGRRPSPLHSIDRIDTNDNYEPANCRWATKAEQRSNQDRNRRLTLNGETRLLVDWGRVMGVSSKTIARRIDILGWPVEKALETPVGADNHQPYGRDRKSACANGHEYTPENTGRDAAGWRFCRTCSRQRQREYMRARRARKKKQHGKA